MAATKSSSIASSSTFLNRSGNKDDLVCERCRDREIQLKEVLDELSSAQVIIDILQKELLTSKAVTSTCAEQQFSTKEHSSNSTTEVWTSSAPNNCSNKHQNYIAPTWAEVAASSHHIPPANSIITPSLKGTLAVHYDIQKDNIGVSSRHQH